jgi:XrtJ-associated TM-motif-TM protein
MAAIRKEVYFCSLGSVFPRQKLLDNFTLAVTVLCRILLQYPASTTNPPKGHPAMKTVLRFAFFGSLFLIPVLAHAQDGCLDSPECPTAVLGLVGAAGAALYARLRK